ncbi:CCHC-type domain-containing protein [Trichonephila clavipes]|nr:CCHC-type domain-containing protein [Trichonephila clavipes]
MPTEQEAKPAVVTPRYSNGSPSTSEERLGKTLLKMALKMVCQQRRRLRFSWEAFKNGLVDFGDRQKYTRRSEEQLKCRAQRSGESTQSYIQSVLDLPREEIVQDEVERVLAPVSTKPTETRPRPTYAAVTRKYRAPVQKFPPEPRKTDVWRTADNRPVCFHCGRPGHVMRYCRERKAVFDNLETADGTSTTLALKKKYADQTLPRRFTPSPHERPIPNTSLQIPVAISPIQSVARP